MFYVKTKLTDEATITAELTDENVFNICPKCGKEVAVDIASLFRDGEGDLYSTAVCCSTCSKAINNGKSHPTTKPPITYDGLVWMTDVLGKSGYGELLSDLFDEFEIDTMGDLAPENYTAFGNALQAMATGKTEV